MLAEGCIPCKYSSFWDHRLSGRSDGGSETMAGVIIVTAGEGRGSEGSGRLRGFSAIFPMHRRFICTHSNHDLEQIAGGGMQVGVESV